MTAIPVVKPVLAGTVYAKTQATASDTFVAQQGAMYLVNIECGAVGCTTTFDDVTTPAPPGSAPAAGWSDVAVTVAPSTNKSVLIAANRFLNSGVVALATTTPTNTMITVLGPL